MDRLFLDANVLFSAAYRPDAGLRRLWSLRHAELCSSHYAVEEAKFNLSEENQRRRLSILVSKLSLFDPPLGALPAGITLPEKDVPILLAAIATRATHLLTGDLQHFGPYLGKRVAGILVLLPGEYLRLASRGR